MGSLRPMQKRARYTKWREPEYRVYLVGYGCERKKMWKEKKKKGRRQRLPLQKKGRGGIESG